MQSQTRIEFALNKVLELEDCHPGMTYEQGVEEALMWVLGDIEDDEFPYAPI